MPTVFAFMKKVCRPVDSASGISHQHKMYRKQNVKLSQEYTVQDNLKMLH